MSFPNANLFPYTAEVDARGKLSLGGCDAVELAAGVRHAALRFR